MQKHISAPLQKPYNPKTARASISDGSPGHKFAADRVVCIIAHIRLPVCLYVLYVVTWLLMMVL